MIKQCGNCELWDSLSQENAVSDCLYKEFPKCFEPEDRILMAYYKEIRMTEWKEYERVSAAAINDIKDRKGVMFNGCFVKETDERYGSVKAQIESKKEIEIMSFLDA